MNLPYKLSSQAEEDFFQIYLWGFQAFGEAEADKYHLELLSHFNHIALDPLIYVAVKNINPQCRRSVHKSHAIYYTVTDEHVLILRILGRQDHATAFE